MTTLEKEICALVFRTTPIEYPIEEVVSGTVLKALGITSLETINIIFELEDQYDIHIETEEMFALETVSDLAGFVEEKMMVED